MAKKKRTPAQRRDAHDTPREVDSYKRFLFALNIAPAVVGEWLRANGKLPVLQRSRTIVLLADALARQVDKGRMSND